jgi:hypothetical protein
MIWRFLYGGTLKSSISSKRIFHSEPSIYGVPPFTETPSHTGAVFTSSLAPSGFLFRPTWSIPESPYWDVGDKNKHMKKKTGTLEYIEFV